MTARIERRRRAQRHGRWAETLALWWLRLKGYRILARDFRSGVGEIDILARRGRVIAAVEVKARGDHPSAATALLPRQQRRIERAAAYFLARRPEFQGLLLRFDVMLVVPRRLPRHLQDAWRPERG